MSRDQIIPPNASNLPSNVSSNAPLKSENLGRRRSVSTKQKTGQGTGKAAHLAKKPQSSPPAKVGPVPAPTPTPTTTSTPTRSTKIQTAKTVKAKPGQAKREKQDAGKKQEARRHQKAYMRPTGGQDTPSYESEVAGITPAPTPAAASMSISSGKSRSARSLTQTERTRETTDTPNSWPKKIFITLSLLTLAGIAGLLSYTTFFNLGIRLDESQSVWQSAHSLPGLIELIAHDVHVPLYHILVHFIQVFAGSTTDAIRALSLGLFVATIPMVYLLARQVLRYNWALVATALFCFSPFVLWYSSEARMYTLVTFLAVCNQYFFLHIYKKNKGWLGFLATTILGIYSHYFFFLNLFAEGLFFLVTRKRFAPRSLLKFLGIGGVAAAAFVPWLMIFLSQGAAGTMKPFIPRPTTIDYFNTYSQFLFGFQSQHLNTLFLSAWPIAVLVALGSVRRSFRVNRRIYFFLTIAILPVMFAFLLSQVTRPFFVSRYMIFTLPALLIVLTWLVSRYRAKLAAIIAVMLIAGSIGLTRYEYLSKRTPVKEDYRTAAEYITTHATPRDRIVLSAPFTVFPFEYYYQGTSQISTIPEWDGISPTGIKPFKTEDLPEYTKRLADGHRHIYVLLSYDQGYEEEIRLYLDKHFKRVNTQIFSEGMSLYVYQTGYTKIYDL